MFLERTLLKQQIEKALRRNPIVVLVGPRQCGKTTLARQFVASDSLNYFDLEDPISLARLDQPMLALRDLTGTILIDEVQRRPELFPVLRVLVDRNPLPSRFLILGSASPELLRQSSESLAGRVETITMSGFHLDEVGIEAQSQHWRRGGFPRSFLAENEEDSVAWRKNFVQAFLERDLPQLGIRIPATTLFRFWTVLAHFHGQVWNAAEAARALEINETSARRYLDLLQSVFMIRQLQPWHANLQKRQIKLPKIYFQDSGLLHNLLGIRNELELLSHPKNGASWEGYVINEVLHSVQPDESYFWATHGGAEVDLLLIKNGKKIGVECKRVDAPRLTPSMKIALNDLRLDQLYSVYPGQHKFPLAERVDALPLSMIIDISNWM